MRICVQPAMVSQGYCPKLCSASEEPCLVSCLDDSWCGPGEKCCHDDCHVQCVAAEPARPGICPRKRALPNGTPCANRCDDDRSCPKGQKCCFAGCGLECLAPATEEPRPCTEASHTTTRKKCADLCQDDADCPTEEKCRPTDCGFRCAASEPAMTKPRPETAGVTSASISSFPGQLTEGPLPASPPPLKPGLCPLQLRGSMGPCPEPTLRNCSNDFDCENTKKCCSISCSSACKEPEAGWWAESAACG
ncbi:whey acidic protein-like [Rhineura floridana]|uniref:whey acidic protein-like n=1 Tax=Rhineura floridana TaxID=261503 RepID=UPI002AC83C0F|nr:whey acidic protein-like [Rhineura floridana]